jgi:(p)ppGpp synthase/HD superfamily hydrolase
MMETNDPIETALGIALRAHQGQKDKAGAPYILHPLRLMLRMESPVERIAALLHDVVEDSAITLADLRAAGLPEQAIATVEDLSKRKGECYEDFIARLSGNPVARKVKLADLEDNMNVGRLPELTPKDLERLAKYHRALRALKTL